MLRSAFSFMNWKHLATIVSFGGAVGAWVTSATSMPGSPSMRTPAAATPAVNQSRADTPAVAAARFHAHLTPDIAPRQPSRNLFAFRTSARGVASPGAIAQPIPTPAPVTTPSQPALMLSGIAEDPGPEGPERTAVISGGGELFLVKQGEAV